MMLSFFRQLAERTDSSSSSTLRSRLRLNGMSSATTSAFTACGSSKLMKSCSWSCRMREAMATASSGLTVPLVSTLIDSLS